MDLQQICGIVIVMAYLCAEITKKDSSGEQTKIFHSLLFSNLKVGEIVEVEDFTGKLANYKVESIKWNFSNFGDVLHAVLIPIEEI